MTLTKDIRWAIQALGVRLGNAANEEELLRRRSARAKSREQNELELMLIISDIRKLLASIEDAVPLINLAITTSGVNLTTNLPATISPSRLLQASTFLTAADTRFASASGSRVQVGPTYTLSLYMLFAGHAYRPQDEEDIRQTTWKEVIHKARLKLIRLPLAEVYDLPGEATSAKRDPATHSIPAGDSLDEYAYQLLLIEDLDDDRVHTFEENEPQPGPVDDVALAGIRDVVPIHEISKIFYADTGKILNIGTEGVTNNPVLLLKRDIYAEPPRRMMQRSLSQDVSEYGEDGVFDEAKNADVGEATTHQAPVDDEQAALEAQIRRESIRVLPSDDIEPDANDVRFSLWRLPPDLDPEWMAFEVYNEEPDSEDESEVITSSSSNLHSSRQPSVDPALTGSMSNLKLEPSTPPTYSVRHTAPDTRTVTLPPVSQLPIKTSLSLLEMLIRLTALQQFRQSSHLTIEDELLNFFLEDSSTTGAGPNAEYRQRVRRDARRRVGFDPYDESPIKRRGEEYLAHPRASPRPNDELEYGSRYGSEARGTPDQVRSSIEYPARQGGVYPRSSPSPSVRPRPPMTMSSPVPAMSLPSMTPPGSLRSRQAVLRSQSEKPRSPLGLGVSGGKADSTLGTSPGSEDAGDK